MITSTKWNFSNSWQSLLTKALPGSIAMMLIIVSANVYAQKVSGELRKWHKVTLTFDGPQSNENATSNPFLDYRMDVTFTKGSKKFVVPGYYAADGNAGETSATSGNKWRVHFSPDEEGSWSYTVSFRKGSEVAVSDNRLSGTSAGYFDGTSGSLSISSTNKTGRDFRAKGRLQYVGKHHLQFAETGEYFIKGGADAPENFLAYHDFDGPFKNDGHKDNLVKDWSAHTQDWRSGDPVWQGSKGKGMIGALNYLAAKGMNAFSFLTMNINGDDRNVFPYTHYNERSRFDCSQLDQWEKVFEHADKLGLYLHFKTQETENDQLLDGGKLGTQRKLYYRMLIARFGHHLALNWNLGEENDIWQELNDPSNNHVKSYADYFSQNDPYRHNIVIHTYPGQQSKVYPYLTGNQSELTGVSIQTSWSNVFSETKKWVDQSAAAGKPWVVANDEQGDHRTGVKPDGSGNNHTDIRKKTLWGNLMAGGAGVEYYFGYQYPQSDLTCEDWRSRDQMWTYTHHALRFFDEQIPFWEMKNNNSLVSNATSYCLAKPGEVYVVYLLSGGEATLDLGGYNKTFSLQWYNPRTGVFAAGTQSVSGGSKVVLGLPPTESYQDWVALVSTTDGNELPTVSIVDPQSDATYAFGESFIIEADAKDADGSINVVKFYDGKTLIAEDHTAPFTCEVNHPQPGECLLSAQATDDQGATVTSTQVRVVVENEDGSVDCSADYVEENGLVVIEAESGNASGWSKRTARSGYTGSGYLEWTGGDHFSSPGNGTISYKIQVNQTGTYRFQWRNRNALNSNSTEHNDTWLRFPDASDFYGERNGSAIYPKGTGKSPNPNGASANGWFKIYTNQGAQWNWQTTTSDNEPHQIYVKFDNPGVYTLQVSGRSNGHAIDRMVLSHSSVSASGAQSTSLKETKCDGTPTANQSPKVNAGSDQTLTLPDNSTSLTASASDSDGSIASYAWSKVSGPSASLSGAVSKTLSASNLVAGSYTFKVTVKDNDGASASDQVNVTVKEATTTPSPTAQAIPGKIEAESYASMQGIQTESTSDTGGGENIGYIENGDYADYQVKVASAGTYEVAFRVASSTDGGTINLKQGSNTIGSVQVNNTGDWQSWQTVKTTVTLASGEQTLRLQFSGESGYLLNVNYVNFSEIIPDTPSEEPTAPEVTVSYILIDAKTDEPLAKFNPLTEGTTINLSEVGKELNIVAEISGLSSISKVQFDYNGTANFWTEKMAPYALRGNNGSDYLSWTPDLGDNTVAVKITADNQEIMDEIRFTVTDEASSPAPLSKFELSPIHDAYLQNWARYNTQELRVEDGRRISYLMFDLRDISESISEAQLELTVSGDAGYGTILVHQGAHSQWTENNLSVNNKPLEGEVLGSLYGKFTGGNTYSINLEGLKSGEVVTVVLVHDAENAIVNDVAFASSEADDASIRPVLKIATGFVARSEEVKIKPLTYDKPEHSVFKIYPNPATNYINVPVESETKYTILSQEGLIIKSGMVNTNRKIDIRDISIGVYFLRIVSSNVTLTEKIFIVR